MSGLESLYITATHIGSDVQHGWSNLKLERMTMIDFFVVYNKGVLNEVDFHSASKD